MNQKQFSEITDWQKSTFPHGTPLSKISHLAEEMIELTEDIMKNSEDRRLEFADCFILLFGAAASDGMTYEDICKAIDEKMEVNYSRKWGKANENGVVNHIKD